MKHPKMLGLAAFQVIFVSQLAANADIKIKQYADWSLFESDDGKLCYISADNTTYGGGDQFESNSPSIFFTLSKAKNRPESPAEVIIRYASGKNRANGAVASISGANPINAADMAGQKTAFWGVSKTLTQFVNQIRNNQIKIASTGKGDRATLTSQGFPDILKEMENRCNQGKPIPNANFEQSFFANMAETLNPNNLDATKVQQLRAIYYAAYEAAFHIANASQELEDLLNSYKPYADELKLNREQHDSIENVQLPHNRSILAEAQKRQVDIAAEIVQLDQRIQQLMQVVAASQKAADDAKAILAPLEPRFNDISRRLAIANEQLLQAQSRLAYIDQRVPQLNQFIVQLRNEAEILRQNIPYKLQLAANASNVYSDARMRRFNFNSDREFQERLRMHPSFQQLRREFERVDRDLSASQQQLRILNQEKQNAARALEQCRANAAQPPQPAPDCSQQEAAVNSLLQAIAFEEGQQNQLRNRQDEISRRLREIEYRIRQEVNREYDRLVENERYALAEYNRLQDDANRDQARLSQITTIDLPRATSEVRDLQQERPGVVASIDHNSRAVADISSELATFKSQTGWEAKYAAVQNTSAKLRQDQANLRKSQDDKADAQTRLRSAQDLEARTKETISSLTRTSANLDARAAELRAKLAELPDARRKFDEYLAQQNVLFKTKQAEFAKLSQ